MLVQLTKQLNQIIQFVAKFNKNERQAISSFIMCCCYPCAFGQMGSHAIIQEVWVLSTDETREDDFTCPTKKICCNFLQLIIIKTFWEIIYFKCMISWVYKFLLQFCFYSFINTTDRIFDSFTWLFKYHINQANRHQNGCDKNNIKREHHPCIFKIEPTGEEGSHSRSILTVQIT